MDCYILLKIKKHTPTNCPKQRTRSLTESYGKC